MMPLRHRKIAAIWLSLTVLAFLPALRAGDDAKKFGLTSPAFAEGDTLADSTVLNGLDCHGPNRSPALAWKNIPAGTKSFVIICDDFEARGGDGFIHWVAYNIPAAVDHLAEKRRCNRARSERRRSPRLQRFPAPALRWPLSTGRRPAQIPLHHLRPQHPDDRRRRHAHDLAQTAFRHPRPDPWPGLAHRSARPLITAAPSCFFSRCTAARCNGKVFPVYPRPARKRLSSIAACSGREIAKAAPM